MSRASRDRWSSGVAYHAYMGRWSGLLARAFLAWLRAERSAHWLEVGCGTGALTSLICEVCRPASIVACDPSEPFVELARSRVSEACASFVVAGSEALPTRGGGFDAIVSGLVLNFIPEPERALRSMVERAAPGGVVAAYVWDYAGGVEFLQHFWEEATLMDPAAESQDESRRFGFWQPSRLDSLFRGAGLLRVETGVLEIPTDFLDFDDYFGPFLGGTGPAPSYLAALDPPRRETLKERLRRRLQPGADGHIRLHARAAVVRGFCEDCALQQKPQPDHS